MGVNKTRKKPTYISKTHLLFIANVVIKLFCLKWHHDDYKQIIVVTLYWILNYSSILRFLGRINTLFAGAGFHFHKTQNKIKPE